MNKTADRTLDKMAAHPLLARPLTGPIDDEVDGGMLRRIRELAADADSAGGALRSKKLADVQFHPDSPEPIQWPADQAIQETGSRLAKLKHFGMECERRGDYFHSGEVALQIQEILNQINALYQKGRRLQKK